jgi:GNAT superfamily N-acetyltransferase
MDNPLIRFARKSDLPAVVNLCALHAAYEQSGYTENHKAERLSRHLFSDPPTLYCLVVEAERDLIGYATYMKQYSTWDAEFYIYMDCLFMTEAARGMGIGEKIVDRIKAEGARLNCEHIQWQTPDFNTRAIKFYRRIGATSKSKERFFLNI